MKKILIMFFMITSFCLYADIIEQTYFFDNYKISNQDGFQVINFDNTLLTGKVGEPVLPYHSVSILLPPGEEAVSIEIIGRDETTIPGSFDLYPQQQSRPISQGRSEEFIINNSIYTSHEIYPDKLSGELITEFMNGFGFALCTFTPVQYIPSKGKITYFKVVTIKIVTGSSQEAISALDNLRTSRNILEKVSRFTQNDQNISLYPNRNSREDEYKILIITVAQFENEFQSYIDLYLMRGLLTEIGTIEYINANVQGQDTPEKIRNYIIQEYQDGDIEQVLLAGDVEHVPYRGFYCYVDSGSGCEDDDIPSDLYYSALDGTWNDDGDNLWGEIGEDDLLPDVSVGRMSFSNLSELSIMLNKTISYQNTPVLDELQKPLLLGEEMCSDPLTWGGDYLDLLIGFHDDNGYTTNGIPVDHDYETMYDRDLGSWSASELIAEINEGHSFIYHVGHANYGYAMRLNNPDITNSNFNMVNGVDHNYTFVYTTGCNCGGFDSDDCIAEHMVKIDNFAAAFVGNSRYGWFNEGQTEGPSTHLHREFVDALYSDQTRWIGSAHLESKIDTSPWVTAPGQWEEGALRWCFYDCNVLGDPALSIWTDEPIGIDVIHNSVILLGTSTYSVHVESGGSPVEDMQCTLMQDGELIGTEATDAIGNAEILFDAVSVVPGEAELIINGYNRPPIVYSIQVMPPAGPYILYDSYILNDSAGNGNGLMDYGELILLTLSIENVGIDPADNVTVFLSTDDQYIAITDSTEFYGNIGAGAVATVTDGFSVEVCDSIPDEHMFLFEVNATDGTEVWTSNFVIEAYAPILSVGDMIIDDSAGNNNGFLDPGETVLITIPTHNDGHATSPEAIADLSCANQLITIAQNPVNLGEIGSLSSVDAVFTVTASDEILFGTHITLNYEVIAGEYFIYHDFETFVGMYIEDFETGDFSSYSWTFDGDANWVIDTDSFEGIYSARSGAIIEFQETWLIIEADVLYDSDISFYRKTSCEDVGPGTGNYYDYLSFYIDDIEMDKWAGETPWDIVSFPVDAGNHTFKWRYIKDSAITSGSDCVWVDYIVFPLFEPEVSTDDISVIPSIIKLYGNYPNPFNPETTFRFSVAQTLSFMTLDIYNIKGQKVKTLVSEFKDVGFHSVIWNGKDSNDKPVSSGIYFYKLKTDNFEKTKKMILMK